MADELMEAIVAHQKAAKEYDELIGQVVTIEEVASGKRIESSVQMEQLLDDRIQRAWQKVKSTRQHIWAIFHRRAKAGIK